MMPKKKKAKVLRCSFLPPSVPDFRYLRTTEVSVETELFLRENGYAVRLPGAATMCDALMFVELDVKDNNATLEVLRNLLDNEIDCSLEGLYQVYGPLDFLVELTGPLAQLDRVRETIESRMNEKALLKKGTQVVSHRVRHMARHWGLNLDLGGGTNEQQSTWLVNPQKYNAIRAFMFCCGRARTSTADQKEFVVDLLRQLDYPVNGPDGEIRASDLVDRIYFDDGGLPILGAMCACGNYYHLNELTNRIDRLLEREYNLWKTTHIVAGAPYFSPCDSRFQSAFLHPVHDLVSKAVPLLEKTDVLDLVESEVVDRYYRGRQYVGQLKRVADTIRKACLGQARTKANYLLQGESGSGKTFFVKQIGESIKDSVCYRRVVLDQCDQAKWEKALATVVENDCKDRPVLCLLDEINKLGDAKWPFDKLRGYLEHNGMPASDRAGRQRIVWVLAGSEGERVVDLKRSIEKRENGPDIITRLTESFEIPRRDEEDCLLIVCSTVRRIADRLATQFAEIEKKAVLYLVDVCVRRPHSLEEVIEAALLRSPPGQMVLSYGLMFSTDDGTREDFLKQYPSANRLANHVLKVKCTNQPPSRTGT